MKSAKWHSLVLVIIANVFHCLDAATCDSYTLKLTYLNIGTWPNESGKLRWGQGIFLSVSPSGASDFQWTVPEGTIRDYDERIKDNLNDPSSIPSGFRKFRHKPLELKSDSISLYFRRESKQVLEADRTVKVSFWPVGASRPCVLEKNFLVSVAERPVELYTSDHQSKNNSNIHMGRVIEDHFIWHSFHLFSYKMLHKHPSFLHWHHLYVDRYQSWLKLFSYQDLKPIYSKDPFTPNELYTGHGVCTSYDFTAIGEWDKQLEGSEDFDQWERKIVGVHDQVHRTIAGICKSNQFGTFVGISSPKSELFWRFHKALDEKYYKRTCLAEPQKFTNCPKTDNF